jgi:glycine oxidase
MQSQQPDAIVVGAGIIGSSIAWRLAQRGLSVELRDAGRMGAQASSAGAGMLAPGGEIEQPSAFAQLLMESARLYPDFVRELSEAAGAGIDYQRCGAIEYATTDAEAAELKARAKIQAAMGIPSEVSGNEGLFYPDDAIVDPLNVLSALRTVCVACGVRLTEHSPVARLDALQAPVVVIAAGAWSGQIAGAPVPMPRSYPVKGHLIGFDLPRGSLGPIRRRGHTYLLQRANGLTVAGATTEKKGFDTAVDPAMAEDVRRRAEALYPPLAGLTPVRMWAGLRPGIEAPEPAIGRLADSRFWLAYGHYRNGILAAPATAARIAASVTSSLEKASPVPRNTP